MTSQIENLPNAMTNIQEPVQNSQKISKDSINRIMLDIKDNDTKLPTRDVPIQTSHIIQDQQIRPNYIPEESQQDYIGDDDTFQEIIQHQHVEKVEKDRLDLLYEEFQTPVLLMVLYFVFQLPIFHKIFQKRIPSLFLNDGNLNMSGFIIKTIMFGVSYYIITKGIEYAGNL